MRSKRVWWTGGAVVVVIVAFGLYWFQPWKLFTSKTVEDVLPSLDAPAAALTSPATPTGSCRR